MSERDLTSMPDGADAVPSDAELISAWMDGELAPAHSSALMARLSGDPALRERWSWLHLAQEAVQSSEVAAMATMSCAERVEIALAGEALHGRPAAVPTRGSRLRDFGLQGLALAAGVAVVAWIAVPMLRSPSASAPVAASVATVSPSVAVQPAGGVPAAAAPQPAVEQKPVAASAAHDGHLDYYLEAHRDLAGGGLMPQAAALFRASYAEER